MIVGLLAIFLNNFQMISEMKKYQAQKESNESN